MQIETKPAFYGLGVRRECAVHEISTVMDEIFKLTFAQIKEEGLIPLNAFSLTYKYDSENNVIEIIGGMTTTSAGKGAGEVEYVTQPERLALVADLIGSYDGLHGLYTAMHAWADEHNIELLAPPCEFYLNDPSQVAPEEYHTQIVWPIKG
jgi:effector-binding domain-containing protein